ncbi:CASP protein 4D1 [Trifolium repens]|nr:CASP protein 4D1 [Trifolium repens]
MVSKAVINSMLVLRIVALAASVATVALIITNSAKSDDGLGDIEKMKFQDVMSYRYVVAVASIAGAYCIVQLPFSLYFVVQQKRLIRNGFLQEFDFYGDKVISGILATGIGAGFAVSIDFKRLFDQVFEGIPKDDPTRSSINNFYVRGIVASSVLSVAFIAMFVVSILSSINRSNKGIFG